MPKYPQKNRHLNRLRCWAKAQTVETGSPIFAHLDFRTPSARPPRTRRSFGLRTASRRRADESRALPAASRRLPKATVTTGNRWLNMGSFGVGPSNLTLAQHGPEVRRPEHGTPVAWPEETDLAGRLSLWASPQATESQAHAACMDYRSSDL